MKEEGVKQTENAVKPGRAPGWVITFFGVVLLPHTACGVFWEPSAGIVLITWKILSLLGFFPMSFKMGPFESHRGTLSLIAFFPICKLSTIYSQMINLMASPTLELFYTRSPKHSSQKRPQHTAPHAMFYRWRREPREGKGQADATPGNRRQRARVSPGLLPRLFLPL